MQCQARRQSYVWLSVKARWTRPLLTFQVRCTIGGDDEAFEASVRSAVILHLVAYTLPGNTVRFLQSESSNGPGWSDLRKAPPAYHREWVLGGLLRLRSVHLLFTSCSLFPQLSRMASAC
jgi:hypothetical protein